MIGVSASALQRIELGSLRLSDRLARRIATLTDVDLASLRAGTVRKIKHRSGEMYSAEHFEQSRRRRESQAMEYERVYMTNELARRLDVLLKTAPRRAVEAIVDDLWDALDEIRRRHGLVRESERMLQNSEAQRRNKWDDIAPEGNDVWFDDRGVRVLPSETTLSQLTKELVIGQNSTAFGRGNGGFLLSISRITN